MACQETARFMKELLWRCTKLPMIILGNNVHRTKVKILIQKFHKASFQYLNY